MSVFVSRPQSGKSCETAVYGTGQMGKSTKQEAGEMSGSEIGADPAGAAAQFWISIAGPVASFAPALFFYAVCITGRGNIIH